MSKIMVSFMLEKEDVEELDKLCTTRSQFLRELVEKYLEKGITTDSITDLFRRVESKLDALEVKGNV